jgi:hypothetical protein
MPPKPQPIIEKFWTRVVRRPNNECWEWIGSTYQGYGVVQEALGSRGHYKNHKAHRLSYMIAYGKIPDGAFVCHHCDNPSCTNPSHLFIGTARDNNDDMISKGRHVGTRNWKKTHCKRGHPYDAENTYYYPDGRRFCRACFKLHRENRT